MFTLSCGYSSSKQLFLLCGSLAPPGAIASVCYTLNLVQISGFFIIANSNQLEIFKLLILKTYTFFFADLETSYQNCRPQAELNFGVVQKNYKSYLLQNSGSQSQQEAGLEEVFEQEIWSLIELFYLQTSNLKLLQILGQFLHILRQGVWICALFGNPLNRSIFLVALSSTRRRPYLEKDIGLG